jgi:hypothetical protein
MEDNMMKKKIFISHGSQDNKFVDNLRESLEIQGLETRVDFSRLIGGDELEAEIKQAIEQARAFIVVLSPNAINSSWVLKEVEYAREVKKKQKQPEDYRVIPLLLPGTGPGGISEAMPQILAALGERQADDIQPMLSRPGEPLEELLLVLSDPDMVKKQDARRARARAKLTYFPGQKGKTEMESQVFFFTAPLGPIENEELTWYLERYFQKILVNRPRLLLPGIRLAWSMKKPTGLMRRSKPIGKPWKIIERRRWQLNWQEDVFIFLCVSSCIFVAKIRILGI